MKVDRVIEHTQNPMICKICGKYFDNETELVTHELTAHPNVKRPETAPGQQSKKDKAA